MGGGARPGEAKYPHVFSPLRLGPVEVPNRIYFAPHYPVKPRPGPSEAELAYYVERYHCSLPPAFYSGFVYNPR